MEKNAEKVRELCTRVIAEKDPDKLAELIAELDKVMGERVEKLRHQTQP